MNKLLLGPILPPITGQSLAFTRFVESLDNKSFEVINTNGEDKTTLLKVLFTIKNLCLILFKTLFTKYDVVYFTCSRSFLGSIKDILIISLTNLKGVKLVNHLHGSDFKEFLDTSPKWYQKVLLHSYKKVDTSIVLLDSMKDQFSYFPDMRIEVVPNFYDKELDRKLVEKKSNNIHIVYLSNIMSSKGIFELIDAFEKLSKIYDNINLKIAGEYIADKYMHINEVRKKFESKISKNKKIKYLGKTFGKDKVKLLQSSDIFILPSYYKSEAFPISIIEAMACENAIVTTNYRYLPEVVSEQNGVLVEPKSVDSLVKGIESLINDKNRLRTIQLHNQNVAKAKYSLDKYIENLNRIVLEKSI